MIFPTPQFTNTSIKCDNTNQLKVPDIKMHKFTSPEPHRKDRFLFCSSNLHELTTVSHRTFTQIRSAECCQWEQIWEENGPEGSDLWSKLWAWIKELWTNSPLTFTLFILSTASEKLWHQQKTWEKRKEIHYKIWRLLPWSEKIILAQIWRFLTKQDLLLIIKTHIILLFVLSYTFL